MQELQGKPKQDFERIQKWLKETLKDDYDKFDIKAHFDSSLSYMENKSKVREMVRPLLKEIQKEDVEAIKSGQEQFVHERLVAAEKEAEEYNQMIYSDNKDIDAFFSHIDFGVKKICQGYSNLLFIRGRGGIGKSYRIRKALIENKTEFAQVCGEVSEAYLYRLIFENNGKVVWFKDVVKLLEGLKSINLLKSATETEDVRVLTKSNYSRAQDDLPDKFVCKCRFIFDYNNLINGKLRDDFEAIVSRGDYIEMAVSDHEIKQLMRLIAKEDWQKEVTNFIVENFESSGIVRLNLRTQWKAFKTYEFCKSNGLDWEDELVRDMKNISKVRALLYSLIGSKVVKTADLKRMLLKRELVGTLRTADNKINEWLYTEELFRWSEADKDFLVGINPKG